MLLQRAEHSNYLKKNKNETWEKQIKKTELKKPHTKHFIASSSKIKDGSFLISVNRDLQFNRSTWKEKNFKIVQIAILTKKKQIKEKNKREQIKDTIIKEILGLQWINRLETMLFW
jgi:hypothetical protein